MPSRDTTPPTVTPRDAEDVIEGEPGVTARYRFVARQRADGRVRIELERQGRAVLPILQRGTIGFDVRPGVALEATEKIVQILNRDIVGVTYIDE